MSAIIHKQSAGILLFRVVDERPEVFLVHMGGPYWAKKDRHAWSIPKGEFETDEDPLTAARREFFEETGFSVDGEFIELGSVKQVGGKVVHAWALEGDVDAEQITSNMFELEWPPNSGNVAEFPEIDRAAWFDVETAREKLIKAQSQFIDALLDKLG